MIVIKNISLTKTVIIHLKELELIRVLQPGKSLNFPCPTNRNVATSLLSVMNCNTGEFLDYSSSSGYRFILNGLKERGRSPFWEGHVPILCSGDASFIVSPEKGNVVMKLKDEELQLPSFIQPKENESYMMKMTLILAVVLIVSYVYVRQRR